MIDHSLQRSHQACRIPVIQQKSSCLRRPLHVKLLSQEHLLQVHEKATKLIDEDGLFSLVAAAPEAASAAAPASAAAKPSELRPIAAGSFYGGKASAGGSDQAKKAALASSSLAASGQPVLSSFLPVGLTQSSI